MNLAAFNFQALSWENIPKEERTAESGRVFWQTIFMNEVRVRKVEYTPGYISDHWCKKGHVLLCMEGELTTDLDNGKSFTLTAGMFYLVGDNCEAHRSHSEKGCVLFIVD